jgi:hypothetical protein
MQIGDKGKPVFKIRQNKMHQKTWIRVQKVAAAEDFLISYNNFYEVTLISIALPREALIHNLF